MNHILDIETRPLPDKVKLFTKPFKKEDVRVGNLKDPEKIAAKMDSAEAVYWQKANDQAALNPHTSEICAIGLHLQDQHPEILSGSEYAILVQFWSIFSEKVAHRFCYYSGSNNKAAFDPRHIIVRSWVNGVKVPHNTVNPRGYITETFCDLAAIYLFGADYPSYCSADMAGRQLGLIGTTNAAGTVRSKDEIEEKLGISGANFHEHVSASGVLDDAAKQYLTNDLAIERGIADIIL